MVLSRVSYLRIATLLPVVVPVPLGTVLLASALMGLRLPEWFGNSAILSGMGIFLFGPLYIAVAGGLLLVFRRQRWKAHAAAALSSPWIMCGAVGLLSGLLDPDATVWASIRFWAPDCLKLGYAYLVVAFSGMALFERAGWVSDAA